MYELLWFQLFFFSFQICIRFVSSSSFWLFSLKFCSKKKKLCVCVETIDHTCTFFIDMGESMVILFKTAEIPYVGVVTVFWRFYENECVILKRKNEITNSVCVCVCPKVTEWKIQKPKPEKITKWYEWCGNIQQIEMKQWMRLNDLQANEIRTICMCECMNFWACACLFTFSSPFK